MPDVLLPRLFAAMTEGHLVRWRVELGDDVRAGAPLADLRAGAVAVDLEAPLAGRISALLATPGPAPLPVGTPLARIEPARVEEPAAPPEAATETRSAREAIVAALSAAMERDSRVIYLGDDVEARHGPMAVGVVLRDRFGGRRVRHCPPTPQAVAGAATGAALGGLRPVVAFANLNLALATLEPMAAIAARMAILTGGRMTCPVVFRVGHGHVPRGGAQMSGDLAALLTAVPGLAVMSPSDAADAGVLMRDALSLEGPVVFLEHQALHTRRAVVEHHEAAPGHARFLRRGSAVSLIAHGAGIALAKRVADALADLGHMIDLVDLRSLSPLDEDTLRDSLMRSGDAVILEDAVSPWSASLAGRICELAGDLLRSPPLCLGGGRGPMPYAEDLENAHRPDPADIARQIAELVDRSLHR